MKALEKGQEKIQRICAILREETLEPAKEEAQAILRKAEAEKEALLEEARKEAALFVEEAHRSVKKEKEIFQASLEQASKQALESLRQDIEMRLFNEELGDMLLKEMASPTGVAKLLTGLIQALDKEGLAADITAVIPKTVDAKQVAAALAENVLQKLKGGSLVLGRFGGGVQLKLANKNIMLDVTDESLKELLSSYLRKDFRKLIFGA